MKRLHTPCSPHQSPLGSAILLLWVCLVFSRCYGSVSSNEWDTSALAGFMIIDKGPVFIEDVRIHFGEPFEG